MLIAWKERGRVDLTERLGAGLGAAVRACRAAHGDPVSEVAAGSDTDYTGRSAPPRG